MTLFENSNSPENIFSRVVGRVQVSIPGWGFHFAPVLHWFGIFFNIKALLFLARFGQAFPTPNICSRVSKWSLMIDVGNRYLGKTIRIQDSDEFRDDVDNLRRSGIAELKEGETIFFETSEMTLSEGSSYQIQRARLESNPSRQPILRILCAKEVQE